MNTFRKIGTQFFHLGFYPFSYVESICPRELVDGYSGYVLSL